MQKRRMISEGREPQHVAKCSGSAMRFWYLCILSGCHGMQYPGLSLSPESAYGRFWRTDGFELRNALQIPNHVFLITLRKR